MEKEFKVSKILFEVRSDDGKYMYSLTKGFIDKYESYFFCRAVLDEEGKIKMKKAVPIRLTDFFLLETGFRYLLDNK